MIRSRTTVRAIDHGWNKLRQTAKNMAESQSVVKVGLLGNGKNERNDGALTNVEIGAIQEFGAGNVPERSFIRSTFNSKRSEYIAMLKKLVPQIYALKMTVKKALDIIGMRMAADMKKRITEGAGIPPPNAPSTIARKGSERPLVDTGQLLNAISWSVELSGQKGHE